MNHPLTPPGDKPKRPSFRSRHRMRSHNEAHGDGHEQTPASTLPAILDHPLVPAGDAAEVLVTTQAALDALLQQLRTAGRFAFDTEFIGEESYHPRLCLVQVATPEGITLIDPLSALDLRPFWELIADADIEKIVHAGQQDLEPVFRHVGQPPRNVFDTQIAAAFAGQTYPMSLDKLVRALAGVEPGRGAKFSHWDRRPLTAVQLRYAANDVRYLPLLRHLIGQTLESLGNTAWATQRCEELSDVSLYVFDAQTHRLRMRGIEWLGPRRRAVLRALLGWREEAAKEQDVPPRSLVTDGVLLDLAREPVEAVAALGQVRGLPRPVERQYGQAIVAATQQALTGPLNPADEVPMPHRNGSDAIADRVWGAVQQLCAERSVDSAVVTSKREITRYVQMLRQGTPPSDSPLARGWRREWLGPAIDAAIASAAAPRV